MSANVVDLPPKIYSPEEITKFYRETGQNDFHWTKLSPENTTVTGLNPPNKQIRIVGILNQYQYDLSNAGLLLSFKTYNSTGAADYGATDYVAPLPGTFFESARLRLNGSNISNNTGREKYHKWAYLSKLLEYDPRHASMVNGYEYLYPDTGNQASAERQKFVSSARVGSLAGVTPVGYTGAAADTANFLAVGVQGGAGTQRGNGVDIFAGVGGVAGSVAADGNVFVFIDDNPNYNDGFNKRCKATNASGIVTVWIPLKYYIPALNGLRDAKTNFNLELNLMRPEDAETMFSANNVADVANPAVPAIGKVLFQKLELHIPSYTPDSYWKGKIIQRLNAGSTSIRKYIDCEIIYATNDLTPGATSTTIDFPSVLDNRPFGCLFAYQYLSDLDSQSGNTHRYFNPGISSAKLQIGTGQEFPYGSYEAVVANNDNLALYRDFLKFAEMMDNKQACMIDYQSFITHKFFVPFDLREIDLSGLDPNQAMKLRFNAVHSALPAAVADNNAANGRFTGRARPGNVRVWCFLLKERAIQVRETINSLEIRADVPTAD